MPKRFFANRFPKNGEALHNPEYWQKKAEQQISKILNNQVAISRNCDGGLYVGAGGVGYMLWYAYTRFKNKAWLLPADQLLATNLEHYKNSRLRADDRLGFLLGRPGITAVSAVLAKELLKDGSTLEKEYSDCGQCFLHPDPLGCGSDEMLVGRAGYILGALWLKDTLHQDVVPLSLLYRLCDAIISSGRAYSEQRQSASPLMFQYHQTEYLGAAHGVAGIIQSILSVPGYLQLNPEAEKDVKSSVDFILSLQTEEGNFPCAMDELGARARPLEDDLVHWCHGAPGTVYMLLRAYLLWRDQRYLQAAVRAAECVWEKGLLKKGPGICHGVAGSGYVFLALYRVTGERNYLYRAERFGDFMFTTEFEAGARTPDSPNSLFEGWAGTVCFLVDLATPDQSSFPFSNLYPVLS